MANRWWIYQRERFPLLGHGPLIAAFSFCAVSYSSVLRGQPGPHVASVVVAFVTALIFFAQLRIADEFKDCDEDAKYRPYRPVPRGLVTLRELAVVFAIGACAQLAMAMWLFAPLALVLLGVWVYLAAMSKEFFLRPFLKARPLLYMVSHMAIMPLIDFYATSTDWLAYDRHMPGGLKWFLCASFFNGMVIEIGRKIRSPADEETGVETYSVVWGRRRAVLAWWFVAAMTFLCAVLAGRQVGGLSAAWITVAMSLAAVGVIWSGTCMLKAPSSGRGKRIETAAGLWTLTLYLSMGLIPLLERGLQ